MKNLFNIISLVVCFLISMPQFITANGSGSSNVVPTAYSGTPGTATFLGPLANTARTYQLLINSDQLTALVGQNITELTWRIPTSATSAWPPSEIVFASYDIYLAESVHPSQRRLTFDSNIVGTKTQVRSGSLTIPANSYPWGGNPNSFGSEITFTTPYPYTGGHLLIEIRHTGFTGTSRTTDAIGTAITGYGTSFSACWIGNYTGTTGNQGNFCIVQLTDKPLPVELESFIASVDRRDIHLNWTTASEINNSGFDIERKADGPVNGGETWSKAAFVQGSGTTSESKNYSFTDKGLSTGKYSYRLKQIDYNGNYEYFNLSSEVNIGVPERYDLSQNYPNPFNPATKINFDLPFDSKVMMKISDITGREIATLVNDIQPAGYYTVTFNASNLSSGMYFYRITAIGLLRSQASVTESGNQQYMMTKKMMVIK